MIAKISNQAHPCDHCSSSNREILFAGSSWEQDIPDDIQLVRCCDCGLIYLSPRPDMETLEDYYAPNYPPYRRAIDEEPSFIMRLFRTRNIRKRRRAIEKYCNLSQGQLLDIGCSTGIFLNEMRTAGWDVRGVETSEHAVEYARRHFKLDIFQGPLEDARFEGNLFNIITLWDVLEHTQSPTSTLKEIYRLLKPGGWLVANIPNVESIDRKLFGPHWLGFDPPRHLFAFPRATFESMLNEVGFQTRIWISILPSYFSFALSFERWLAIRSPGLAKFTGWFIRISGIRFLFEPYFAIANIFQFSGLISVFTQKPEGGKQHGTT
jgi:SAM-dependent methyltransferase